MNVWTFIAATVIGIAPAAVIFAFVGQGLDGVIADRERAFNQCVTAKGAANCSFDLDASHFEANAEFEVGRHQGATIIFDNRLEPVTGLLQAALHRALRPAHHLSNLVHLVAGQAQVDQPPLEVRQVFERVADH